ncbi:DMT family transporter [uncultured Litoreibacter sp.]|uniref:DMT family transporter n=1 Tax=uncultured Litoreibacter sp. TaxID=1392394 RepID=UPI002613A12E|nr:DMT family transporter [uncultured Litoreibacter sp.]
MAASRTTQAALFSVTGMALIGFIDNFVRVMAQDIGLWQFHLARSSFVLAMMVPLALAMGWQVRPLRFWAVAVRSFFIATSMVLYFGAVAVLPIAQVGAGLFTAPIFILVFSALFFGLSVGKWRIFAVMLGFAGVLVLLRPEAGAFSAFSLIPVLAGALYGFGSVCTRQYCEGEGTIALLTGFFVVLGLWGALGLIWFAATGQVTDPARDGFFGTGWQPWVAASVFWTAAQGIVSVVAIGCITRAYQIGEASRVAVFEYSFLIFAGFWSYILFNELPDVLGLLGIALIIAAGVVIILRSGQEST